MPLVEICVFLLDEKRNTVPERVFSTGTGISGISLAEQARLQENTSFFL